ncbi:DUF6452 family protein [Aquimarina spongiae]|uniref:Uncharacterized protein n=1 Tax=Aquimarina spongiae TaxID=570521 RepID=A0A1M6BNE4_9FLAO|nr:DUF6452 family protein [Aquimarina spongiae]SHI50174.1 hypothetical protein SAMN04488508_101923 [Aquimarina spongiae]
MRINKFPLFLFLLAGISLSFWGCERDDICAEGTPTTPMLIIKFLDFDNTSEIKNPVELEVRAVGVENPFNFGTVTDSIMIPLRTNESITEYQLTINSDTTNDEVASNTDTISIQYTPEEEYVSSACGFRVTFQGLSNSPVEAGDDGTWIQDINVERLNVTDETTAHIFIFH